MIKTSLLLVFGFFVLSSTAQNEIDSLPVDLTKYTGFYNVGTKPGKSRFMARIYLQNGQLMFSAPGGSDSPIKGYRGNHRFDGGEGYSIQFEVNNNTCKGFILKRPREVWSTDLYGARNLDFDSLVDSKSLDLSEEIITEHFILNFTSQDNEHAQTISKYLEHEVEGIAAKFLVTNMPKVTVRIYPDFESYHLAVLSPGAPKWQKGMAWSEDDIRMVSPEALDESDRNTAGAEGAIHEFVHCVTMHIQGKNVRLPRWLWEGVAMYAGCCQFYDPNELQYLNQGKRPPLDSNSHPERAYELGYYAVEYLESKFGWSTVIEMIKNGGNTRKVLRQSRSQFEKGFYDYLQTRYF